MSSIRASTEASREISLQGGSAGPPPCRIGLRESQLDDIIETGVKCCLKMPKHHFEKKTREPHYKKLTYKCYEL